MAKLIMVQGTSSGVGKSILSLALCRIFKQDGYKVAPFKAQNMSSNYHVLNDGKKMARSQAICAYACGLEPDFRMNPILLMPQDNETFFYLNGENKGLIDGFKYKQIKTQFLDEVLKSFDYLCQNNDIIVIEGAGSPVELNLSKSDIVNMGFAREVNSPVILVSDINRGGVFASLYGTINLLEKADQNLVKGIVVNKFKGDISHFADGKEILENICKKQVVGIVPHFNIEIEDEDALVDTNEMKTKDLLMKNNKINSDKLYLNYLENQFDIVAENFRKNLNMDSIYKILMGEI